MKTTKVLLSVALLVLLAGCGQTASDVSAPESTVSNITEASAEATSAKVDTTEPPKFIPLVPEREILIVAKTLRGECYDDQPDDKREVVRVICNRVSVGAFGDSIEAIIAAPKQFAGYRPDNEPTENDFAIAEEILTEWYEGGCRQLSEYLFFSSGGGHKNVFRKEWRPPHG